MNFEIRFHLDPEAKVMKTQDKKTVYMECGNEGWKFKSDIYKILKDMVKNVENIKIY